MRDGSRIRGTSMTLIEAAKRTLKAVGRPMHSKEIIAYAQQQGWIKPEGKTPDHSLQAAVFKHMKAERNQSEIVTVGRPRAYRKYTLRHPTRSSGGPKLP